MKANFDNDQIIKVSSVVNYGVPRKVVPLEITDASDWDASREIEEEKRNKAQEDERRYNVYLDILLGKPDDNWHYYHGLLGFSSIIMSNVLCSIITLIPMHNVIEEPFYFYETLVQAIGGFFLSCAAYMMLNGSYWMNTDRIKSWKKFVSFYLFLGIVAVVIGVPGKVIWSEGLGYPHPFPFYGMIIAYIVIGMSLVGIWYWVSKEPCWLVLGGNGSIQSSTVTGVICLQKIYYFIVGSAIQWRYMAA